MKIEIIETKLFDATVADEIVASINDAIGSNGHASLALSGGKTPASIYRLLTLPERSQDIEWPKLKLFWGDERWVAQNHDQSNYKMVCETLLNDLPKAKPQVFPVDTSLQNAEIGAQAYSLVLNKELKNKPFDIVLLGLGDDGHTASLFPGMPALDLSLGLVCATKNPHDQTVRISLTKNAIANAKKIIFIVKGESKATVLRKILKEKTDYHQYPASLFALQDNTYWFVDTAAGSKLA